MDKIGVRKGKEKINGKENRNGKGKSNEGRIEIGKRRQK